MAETFIFIGTHRLKPGKKAEYERAVAELTAFVQDNEPQVLLFATYFDQDGEHVTGVQVHPHAHSMLTHMQLVRQHIADAYTDYIDETVSIQVFGQPTDEVTAMMERLAGDGVPISINRPSHGFARLPSAPVGS